MNYLNSIRRNVKQNSPLILSVAAGVGTVVTAYLTARASFKAAEVIRKHEEEHPPSIHAKERLMDRTKLVWRLYIPAAVSGSSTIVSVVGANRAGARKFVAANSAIAVADQAFAEYRDKVAQQLGAGKEQAVRDQIAEDKIKATAPAADVMLVGGGEVLCLELYTGRYFKSEMETIQKARNKINAKLNSQMYATLSDFYYEIGLPFTSVSSDLGWKDGRHMELITSASLTDDGRPCLAFDYNYVGTL